MLPLRLFIVLLAAWALSGCKSRHLEGAVEEVSKQIESLKPAKENVENLTKSEIEKLWIHEYKVEELSASTPTEEIEARLIALGLERWECFHIEPKNDSLQIFCKRRPKSYLRYIPRMF